MTPRMIWCCPGLKACYPLSAKISYNRFGALREKGGKRKLADEVVPYDCARSIGILDPEIELIIG